MDVPRAGSTGWTTLAHLLRPQGRKGELLAELTTDFPERFEGGSRVFLARPEFSGTADQARSIAVLGHWLPVGRNHGRIVLSFQGVSSIEQAEELAGLEVLVPAEERMELEDDAEYISDLVGCIVFDGAERIGEVTGVDFATTPDGSRRLVDAPPLLTVLASDGGEVLIPYVQSFLVALSPERKRIEMKLPSGLVELNRPAQPGEDPPPAEEEETDS